MATAKQVFQRVGMRRTLFLVGLVAVLATACAGAASSQAPDIRLTLFDGGAFRLSDLKGKNPVVVNFWFPSCPPCRAEMPFFEKLWQQNKEKGIVFLGVFAANPLDTEEDAKQFIREVGVTYKVGTDGDGTILREYDVSGFPATFFINKRGEIINKWVGSLTEAKLAELVDSLLRG